MNYHNIVVVFAVVILRWIKGASYYQIIVYNAKFVVHELVVVVQPYSIAFYLVFIIVFVHDQPHVYGFAFLRKRIYYVFQIQIIKCAMYRHRSAVYDSLHIFSAVFPRAKINFWTFIGAFNGIARHISLASENKNCHQD